MIMSQEFTPQTEVPMTPVNPTEDKLNNFDIVTAAEAITAENAGVQPVAEGAEQFLQEQAYGDETIVDSVEFNMDMVRLFMLLSRNKETEEARGAVASAIALDAAGQKYGVEELTFRHAAMNRFAADRETERLLREELDAAGSDREY